VCNDFGKNVNHLDLVEGHNTHGISFLCVLHLETRNKLWQRSFTCSGLLIKFIDSFCKGIIFSRKPWIVKPNLGLGVSEWSSC
jgi:hypothetical protein